MKGWYTLYLKSSATEGMSTARVYAGANSDSYSLSAGEALYTIYLDDYFDASTTCLVFNINADNDNNN